MIHGKLDHQPDETNGLNTYKRLVGLFKEAGREINNIVG